MRVFDRLLGDGRRFHLEQNVGRMLELVVELRMDSDLHRDAMHQRSPSCIRILFQWTYERMPEARKAVLPPE
ncbi:hypothetical protein JAGODDHD_04277 [Sphingomonas paucimobilis]|jgi:hypothetical protein|nr:hypothetical protein [Sphingomonas paucimobilis]